jgi:hypothetical protein
MKAAKKIVRILILFLTSTWGVVFGIFAPVIIIRGETPIFSHPIMNVWMIAAVVGYIVPCFLVMLDLYKTAAGFSVAGTVMFLYVHGVLSGMLSRGEDSYEASFMYLPQIFMTILTILYIFIVTEFGQKRKEELNAPAQSILERKD